MIDWNAEIERFWPIAHDRVVQRHVRRLSAAYQRAKRYEGTERGDRYAEGIARRLAQLASVTAVRFDLVADLMAIHGLLTHFAFEDVPVYVVPRRTDLRETNRKV